jgi:peptidoglycan/LPS O-acetylase OafA/YrhL
LVQQQTSVQQRYETLDWFRGLGILAVLWGHAGLPWLPGAYLFIDTFFVISGYLVCQSFLRLNAANPENAPRLMIKNIGQFLGGRFRRIAIPLAATVLLTIIAGWFVLLPDDLFALGQSAQATLLLQAHWYALTLGSYFDVVGKSAPLLHTWSLSLEEWFYLMTPFLLLPIVIWPSKWWVLLLVGLAGLSLYQAQIISSDPEALGASYSMFSTRVWQFMLGLICAVLLRPAALRLPRAVNDGLLLAGLACVFASVLLLTEKAASPGLITLPAVLGVLAVLVLTPQSALFAKATSTRVITFLGRKIYTLYLVHYPFMVYFTYLGVDFGPASDLIKFAAALVISLALYYVLEAPLRGWQRIGFGKVLGITALLVAVSFAFAFHIQQTGGAPKRLSDSALAAWTARFDVNPNRSACMQRELTRFGYSCAMGPTDGPFFALLGDSHSDVFANQLAIVLAEKGIGLRHYWYAECPSIGSGLGNMGVFSSECAKISHEAHQSILLDPNLAGVIYAARWPWYLNDKTAQNVGASWRAASGVPRGYTDMAMYRSDFAAAFKASIADFGMRNVPVFIISPVPSLTHDPVRAQVLGSWGRMGTAYAKLASGAPLDEYNREREQFDQMFADIEKTSSVTLIDVRDSLCSLETCQVYGEFRSIYYDDNHLNEAGAGLVIRGSFADKILP